MGRVARKQRTTAVLVLADPPYNQKIKEIQGRGKIKYGEFLKASGEMIDPLYVDVAVRRWQAYIAN